MDAYTRVDDEEEQPGGSSLGTSVANAAKTILGAGVLSLSWAFYYSTLWPGVFLTVVMCLLSAHGFYMLGVCSEVSGKRAYGEIWKHCFGDGLAWLPNLVLVTYIILNVTACLIICGDFVPKFLSGAGCAWAPLQDRRLVIALVLALIAPLNFLEDLSRLGFTSMIGTVGSLYTCCVLLFEAASGPESQTWEPLAVTPGVFLMIPVVTFAFNGHFNAPDIYQQLARRSPERWMLVTTITFGLCLVVSVVCAVSGYLLFGADLSLEGRSNVLNAPAFRGKRDVMVSYLATVLSLALGIPLYVHNARNCLEFLWLHGRSGSVAAARGNSKARRSFFTSLTMAAVFGLSMIVDDLGLVNAVAGAVCGSLTMNVFPSLMFLRCTAPCAEKRGTLGHLVQRVLPWFSITFGSFVGVAGVVMSVLHATNSI